MQFRKPQLCTLCNRDLKFKYKPEKSWNITGYLCSDCHMKTTKEFMIKQKEKEEKNSQKQDKCFVCHDIVDQEKKKKARWQWGMENDILLCEKCYTQKEQDYQQN